MNVALASTPAIDSTVQDPQSQQLSAKKIPLFVFSISSCQRKNEPGHAHVDLVMKYARGKLARDLGHYASDAAY